MDEVYDGLSDHGSGSDPDRSSGSGASQVAVVSTGRYSIVVADHLAIIEANHKALMTTITRCAALTVSSVLAVVALFGYFYCKLHAIEAPIPDWVIGVIFSSFGGELYVQAKHRLRGTTQTADNAEPLR